MTPGGNLLIELLEDPVVAVKRLIGDALRMEIVEERSRVFLTLGIDKINSWILIHQRVVGERNDFQFILGNN